MTNAEWREEVRRRNELYTKMTGDLVKYEAAQYRKAFLDGTDEAWKRYRANLKRKINAIKKETGFTISLDRLMNA